MTGLIFFTIRNIHVFICIRIKYVYYASVYDGDSEYACDYMCVCLWV